MTVVTEQYRVALRYVTALLDHAEEKELLDKIEGDFSDLQAMISGSEELQRFIRSPLSSRDEKINAVTAIAKKAKFDKITQNFLALLASNRRLMALETIIFIAHKQIAARKGQVTAHVDTAHVLSDAQTKALKESLRKGLGKDVNLEVQEDKDLLGGLVVRVGSVMIDDSVKTKIIRLGRRLKSEKVNSRAEEEVA